MKVFFFFFLIFKIGGISCYVKLPRPELLFGMHFKFLQTILVYFYLIAI